MKLKVILLCISMLLGTQITQAKKEANLDPNIEFFLKAAQKSQKKYSFNEYEHLISGVGAFLIGNIGYLSTDSAALKVAYSGIQTIGIINIGHGVYQRNSPDIQKSFYQLLTTKKTDKYSKPMIARNLIKIFATDERAKRLSLFYSTSFLSFQYLLNATVYDSPDRVKNIYIFFSGINAIIAAYSALYKSDYEKQYFGDSFDINPIAFKDENGAGIYGLNLAITY